MASTSNYGSQNTVGKAKQALDDSSDSIMEAASDAAQQVQDVVRQRPTRRQQVGKGSAANDAYDGRGRWLRTRSIVEVLSHGSRAQGTSLVDHEALNANGIRTIPSAGFRC